MKKLLLLAVAVMAAVAAQAQIPDRVKEIMDKCSQKMNNPAGLEIDMKLHVGMVVISMNGTMKVYSKGDKAKSIVSIKMMGQEIKHVSGFDGENDWELKPAVKKDEKDSLIITKADKKAKGDYDMDLDMTDTYGKAELKEKGKFYVITFTKPKDKDDPKKSIVKISKESYYLQEMEGKMGIGTMTMTVEKYKVGVSDDKLRLDPDEFPGAVVVRK